MANKFISKEEESAIISAISLAEQETSGEIRVHLESTCNKDSVDRAIEVFNLLKMDQTLLKNGVLIYVAIKDRKLAIIGDTGINEVVPSDFWDSTRDLLVTHFKDGKYVEGLVHAIEEAGKVLKQYFPFKSDDQNELSNEISLGN
ncbi:MAG TPA: TPM domain-containing protein [Flavobacteriales bacterium]|nr:TPM domain-containing protein [Flavobacteriales bacterium]HPH81173.1 TPM domain-containing protein [Flavobacteriales bacterium]